MTDSLPLPPGSDDAGGPQSTRSLVAGFEVGDSEASEALVERYRPDLLKRAEANSWMKAISRHTSAEDVVQEVFWRAFSSNLFSAREERESGALRRALIVVLERVLADHHRRLGSSKRGSGVSHLSLDVESKSGGGETSSSLMGQLSSSLTTPTVSARSAELIRLCQDHLEEREWTVWRLRVVAGLSFEEIGGLQTGSAASIRGIYHRARMKLILALAELDPESFAD